MSNVVINSTVLQNWDGGNDVVLHLSLDQPIVVPSGQTYGSAGFVAKFPCTVNAGARTLTIPQVTLPATLDALVGNVAKYQAEFRKSTGALIQTWAGFESFGLLPTTPTEWGVVSVYNRAGIVQQVDRTTLSRYEILSLFNLYVLRLAGWEAPTGTVERDTFATYTAPVISNPPTQAEVQAIANHLQLISRHLAALILDTKQ